MSNDFHVADAEFSAAEDAKPHECIGDGRSCGTRHRNREMAEKHLDKLRRMYCQWCGCPNCGKTGHRNDVCAARWYNGTTRAI